MDIVRKLKNSIIKLCRNKVGRSIVFPVVKLSGRTTYIERVLKNVAETKYFNSTDNNRMILKGPFKGMQYASFDSYGSELAPKIIGSYEMELNDIIEAVIKDSSITEIIDVGSADGYYAVGFAMRKKEAQVFAYDIQEEAISLCKSLAAKNDISSNISYGNFCSNETLKNFKFRKRGFVMSDCEGYELNLFDSSNINNLLNCDVLIEMHDFIDPRISPNLKELFSKTHDVLIIKYQRRNPKDFPELSSFTNEEQRLILSECRLGILNEQPMEWLYAKARR